MRNIRDVVAVGLTLAALGCGSAEEAALLEQAAMAGSGAMAPLHWRGIQSCKGKAGDEDVVFTEKAAVDEYTASKTQIALKGVLVGPPEYSCGPLDFDGVVTSTSVATYFENPMTRSCTSSSGKALVVSKLDGYDLDQRSAAAAGGKWNLSFDLQLETPKNQAVDAGAAEQARTEITCHFELTLQ
jgi:hypothetical protein